MCAPVIERQNVECLIRVISETFKIEMFQTPVIFIFYYKYGNNRNIYYAHKYKNNFIVFRVFTGRFSAETAVCKTPLHFFLHRC